MNISQVSKKYQLSADTLRYYEKIGIIPTVTRDSNGNRMYSEQDLNWVYFAKIMRKAGVSVNALVEYIALFQTGREQSMAQRQAILLEEKRKLEEQIDNLNEALSFLNTKIDDNAEHLAKFEERLDEKNHKTV
ncbi:MerR family transcriptional regulator [Fundicoccus culcitae]|uniref:MerR family transcriptional regulator n=1 Tax=Fundicoccus culcitae TaxID=2969821 RepID=A0ABY5PA35_9LACT|nr:MerR family transcriptional regulator [Fundicoccus culcitae]UUX35414.1 MerR family transcriptional regulator [Fundicoccus culcitae]